MTGIEPPAIAPKSVLRAVSAMQHGEAVAIETADGGLHVAIHAGADGAGAALRPFCRPGSRQVLVWASAYAQTPGLPAELSTGKTAVLAGWTDLAADPIAMLACLARQFRTSWCRDLRTQTALPNSGEALAVELALLARLPPVLVVAKARPPAVPLADGDVPARLLMVHAGDLADCADRDWPLRRVAEARLPLLGAEYTRIVAFRPADGGPEHMAVIVGDPDPMEPVRTVVLRRNPASDLLESLRGADGNRLRSAIGTLAASGGGVVIDLSDGNHRLSQAVDQYADGPHPGFGSAHVAQSIEQAGCWASRHVLAILQQLGYGQVHWMSPSD